jgi:hypothetical protein
MTTFYCLRFETLPTCRARSPYLYPPGTGWLGYAPRHWVPFPSPLTMRRVTVEVFDPTFTREFWFDSVLYRLYSLQADPLKTHPLSSNRYKRTTFKALLLFSSMRVYWPVTQQWIYMSQYISVVWFKTGMCFVYMCYRSTDCDRTLEESICILCVKHCYMFQVLTHLSIWQLHISFPLNIN